MRDIKKVFLTKKMQKIKGFTERTKIRLVNLNQVSDIENRLRTLLYDVVDTVLNLSNENPETSKQNLIYAIKFGINSYDFTGMNFHIAQPLTIVFIFRSPIKILWIGTWDKPRLC